MVPLRHPHMWSRNKINSHVCLTFNLFYSGLEKNHDFFEKIEKIDLIDLIDDLIDKHIQANFRLFSYRIPIFVIKINPVHCIKAYNLSKNLMKIHA